MNKIIDNLKQKYPSETQFHQAVADVLHSISSLLSEDKIYAENGILERLTEPDRIIQFRVTWMNEDGEIETNRGWRVQYNNAMGPYKGGLRFHPNVSLDTFKFLGFEQTFKNIDDIFHKDAGCFSELDYTEQSSWMLFLKYLGDI